jgi:hypothetical protein
MDCESKYYGRTLHVWAWSFINDQKDIPENRYGFGNRSVIDDEDFAQEIHLHL